VTDVVAEISAATQEQSGGINEVNLAITQMDETTQQNAALVEQAAAADSPRARPATSLRWWASSSWTRASSYGRWTGSRREPASWRPSLRT
jgi:hypothetical protein